MAVATFDTLKFANTLKAAGVPERQAEAQAVAFAEVIQINLKDLVTKEDLGLAVGELKREIREVAEISQRELREIAEDSKRELRLAVEDLKRENKEVAETSRRETKGVADDYKRELKQIHEDIKRDNAETKRELLAEMKAWMAKYQGETIWVRWMLGVLITVVIGLSIRMLFVRPF